MDGCMDRWTDIFVVFSGHMDGRGYVTQNTSSPFHMLDPRGYSLDVFDPVSKVGSRGEGSGLRIHACCRALWLRVFEILRE